MKLLTLSCLLLLNLACSAQKIKPKPANKVSPKPAANAVVPLFNMEFEIDGKKTIVSSSDFEDHDGYVTDETKGRQMLFFGAGNSKKNDDSFMVNGLIGSASTGTFTFGTSEASLGIMNVAAFPDIPIFSAKSGTLTITRMPARGGWVEGTFSMESESMDNAYKTVHATITGSFKIKRK